MINCLIVDDEQHAIDVLVHYVKQLPFLSLQATTTNPLEALQLINTGRIDLLFLDIQMPEISGMDLLRTIHGKCKVILTTAYSEFAAEGFEWEAVDYLLKPVPFPRFLKAVQRVQTMLANSRNTPEEDGDDGSEDDYFFVRTESKGKMLKINFSDIDYIEGVKNYVAIYHNGEKTMALLNMKDLEERLPERLFMRIHRSFIIAVQKITAIEGNKVLLRNHNADILLGETYKAAFFEMMKGKIMQ